MSGRNFDRQRVRDRVSRSIREATLADKALLSRSQGDVPPPVRVSKSELRAQAQEAYEAWKDRPFRR